MIGNFNLKPMEHLAQSCWVGQLMQGLFSLVHSILCQYHNLQCCLQTAEMTFSF